MVPEGDSNLDLAVTGTETCASTNSAIWAQCDGAVTPSLLERRLRADIYRSRLALFGLAIHRVRQPFPRRAAGGMD